jgi:hypothetical protein
MHLLIPSAGPWDDASQAALRQLSLPNLGKLLSRLTLSNELTADDRDLCTLAERVHARMDGLPDTPGLIPRAALDASQLGFDTTSSAWAWLTPCHWNPQSNHVGMTDPDTLGLSDEDSRVFMNSMQAYFQEDGINLHFLSASTWLASGAVFQNLPTASLDRVRGQAIDPWMPRQEQAKPLRRLQNEMQMLLYAHPLNDQRPARGLATVNSFWVSGTGALPTDWIANPNPVAAPHTQLNALHKARQTDDPTQWARAWEQLDESTLAPLLTPTAGQGELTLTLCGEHKARTYEQKPQTAWTKLRRRLVATPAHQTLQTL